MNRHFAGRNIALAAAVLFATGAARLAAADDLPKAETILDKFIDATGGKAAYQKIHNEMTTGAMTIAANGISGTLTVYHAEPDKSYTEINIEGVGKLMEGTDGKVAWSLSAIQGPHVKEGSVTKKIWLISFSTRARRGWHGSFCCSLISAPASS